MMITVQEALSWLNYEEGVGHLSNSSFFSVWQIRDTNLPDAHRAAAIRALVDCMRSFTDPKEKAEVFVNLGEYQYLHKNQVEATQFLEEAKAIYTGQKDFHRQAVTDWMLYIVRYNFLERIEAHALAHDSIALFTEQANHYKLFGNPGVAKSGWYQAHLTDMIRDLDSMPEEAFEWITKYEGSQLSGSAALLQESIRKVIKGKYFPDAYRKIEALREITRRCPNVLETAEAQAFCGLCILQMGSASEAVPYLKSAMACVTHNKHWHTSVRWMLGLVLSSIASEQCNGIIHMEASLRGFNECCKQADWRNKPDAVTWYHTHLQAMETVLKDRVRIEL